MVATTAKKRLRRNTAALYSTPAARRGPASWGWRCGSVTYAPRAVGR